MKKVIIADDYEYWRKTIVEIVCSNDVKTEEVGNGSELVERVKLGKYNHIFTENDMPKMNGLEAISEIRKFNKETPIYLLSSTDYKPESLEKQALEYGANGFINKLDDDFSERIENVIKRHL